MAHSSLNRAVALSAVAQVVSSQFVCPSGWSDKSGTPTCAGAVSSSCTSTTCCDEMQTCSDFQVAWLLSQVADAGCAVDTKFFDTKKSDTSVAAPAGEAEVKAACCTPFTDAKCSDWVMSCPSGKDKVGTNDAPPDGDTGKTLTQTKFNELCCVDSPSTCSDFQAVWLLSQALNGGCAPDTKFFDTKKTDVEVADPAGEAEVKAACCTPFADAKCSDWAAVLGSCPSGKDFVGTNNAAPDNDDGKTLSVESYRETCCVDTPKTCSHFQVAWVISQGLNGGCAPDTKFFDTKKSDTSVAAPAGEAEVKAACCTPFANAKCSDWVKSCPSGKEKVTTNNAPPDNDDGKTLSQSKFNEMCCIEPPKTCSNFQVAWLLSQVADAGCAVDTKFFDTKKTVAEVAAPAGEAEVKAACCTPFADAKCSDWAAVLGTCPSGTVFVGTDSAPPDSEDGKSLSQDKYQEMCCQPPKNCADYDPNEADVDSAAWAGPGGFILSVTSLIAGFKL